LVLIQTLGQTHDDLVVYANPIAIAKRIELGSRKTAAGPKATKTDVSLQARAPARVYLHLS